jgi:2-oxoisovalerate dehydrogenase E2 component (dihydrolipoyl transacylase)
MSEYIFKLPDLAEGTVEAEIGEWLVKAGDDVSEEDVICTMITDKAAVEITSPVSGRVRSLSGEVGSMVSVGAPLIVIDTDAVSEYTTGFNHEPDEDHLRREDAVKISRSPESPPSSAKVITSPAIRRRAKEAGVDLAKVRGSGPGGRILREDFEKSLRDHSGAANTPSPTTSTTGDIKEVRIIGLRRVIAERMAEAHREIPAFTYVEEVDVTELESLRRSINEERDTKVTLLAFIGLALVRVLAAYPQCNATYDRERNILLRHRAIHLGIATRTPEGLKVPVIRHCERRSLFGLGMEIKRVSEGARNKSIPAGELAGSTITITSLGKLGGIVTTPIINAPEVAIIGVNRAAERAVVLNGQIGIRLMMNISSSFDHRFIDGHEAAEMVQTLKSLLERPAKMFIAEPA